MTKWTWLEWLQPDVCSYEIIFATGHSEECVQPGALGNGENSVQLGKGRLRWKVLWFAVDHRLAASRKHQEDLVLGRVCFLQGIPFDATILSCVVSAVRMTKEVRGELFKSAPATCDTWRYVAVSLQPSQQKAWSSSDRGLSNHDPICLMGMVGLIEINAWK